MNKKRKQQKGKIIASTALVATGLVAGVALDPTVSHATGDFYYQTLSSQTAVVGQVKSITLPSMVSSGTTLTYSLVDKNTGGQPPSFISFNPSTRVMTLNGATVGDINTYSLELEGYDPSNGNVYIGTFNLAVTAQPNAPVITSPKYGTAYNQVPTVTGTGEAGASVKIYLQGILTRTATVDANGMWSATLPDIGDNNYSLYAYQTLAGNQSSFSNDVQFVMDRTAPATPTITTQDTTGQMGKKIVTVTYPSDAAIKEYRLASTDSWTVYTGSVAVNTALTFEARATDAAGNQSISSLQVDGANHAPTLANAVPTQTVSMGSPITIDISNVFKDVDGDTLTYTANAINPDLATVSLNGTKLTITPVNAGTAKVNLRVGDGYYMYMHNFTVNVVADTTPPVIDLSNWMLNGDNSVATVIPNVTDNSGSIAVKKWAKGDQPISYFDNGGTVFTDSFDVNQNAKDVYTVFAMDAAGNKSVATKVLNWDTTPPVISLENWTISQDKTKATVTPVITDESAIMNKIWIEGSHPLSDFKGFGFGMGHTFTNSFDVPKGTYTVYAVDTKGNQSAQVITLDWDTTPPEAPVPHMNTDGFLNNGILWTRNPLTITFTFPSDSVKNEISLDAGVNWSTYTGAVTMDPSSYVPGKIPAARATDAAGNLSAIGYVSGFGFDTTAPELILSADQTDPTNKDVTITITSSDYILVRQQKSYQSGVKRIQLPDGTYYNNPDPSFGTTNAPTNFEVSTSYKVTENGTYTFVAEDAVGNKTTKTFTVNNIDKTAPTTPTFTADNTAPTNENVSLTISYSEDSVTKEYRVNGGAWTAYTASIVMTTNGLVEARGTDAIGNVSAIGSYNISNIDKIAPTTPSLIADKTTPTNMDVKVTITYPADAANKEYRINGGTWTAYTTTVTMTDNGLVEARATDAAGNVSEIGSLTISNIEKSVPQTPTLRANLVSPTNSDVIVTITYDESSTVKQYKVGSGEWLDYTAPVVVTTNTSVSARSFNAGGIPSEIGLISIGNIDKTAPNKATFTADKTSPTNSDVVVTVIFPSDVVVKQVKVGVGEWTDYVSPVTFSQNGTLTARSKDDAGNWSEEATYTVSNISKAVAPAPTFSPDKVTKINGSVTVTINFDPSSAKKLVKIGANGTYLDYTAPVVMTENGTVYAKSIDAYGNMSAEGSYTVSNIDRTVSTPLQIATDKVALAETMKRDPYITNAIALVSQLDPSDDKNDLIARLNVVINGLADSDTKTTLMSLLNGVSNTGGADDEENEELQAIILQQLIDAAEAKVKYAEQYRYDVYMNAARELVDTLPDIPERAAFYDRLNKLLIPVDPIVAQAIKNADSKVKLAETYKKDPYYTDARTVVNNLPDVADKLSMTARLDAVQDAMLATLVSAAETKVKQAETYKRDPYITNAWTAVNGLPASAGKDALTLRMNNLVNGGGNTGGGTSPTTPSDVSAALKTADTKVKQAEGMKRDPYVTDAWKLVNALPDGADNGTLSKTALVARMKVVDAAVVQKAVNSVATKVTTAEKYKKEPYITNAWIAVLALSDSQGKSDLIARMILVSPQPSVEEIQAYYVKLADTAVKNYEKYRLSYYKTKAVAALVPISEGADKTALQARIDAVTPK